ncbi:MAG: Mn-dependent transcriptional regulator MntRNA [Oscillospiraceae bacterium]|nr:Mn-dependent transcriptional regulator MntRNA [Oscillospiraceae bacterium]
MMKDTVNNSFYTLKGYSLEDTSKVSSSMEDYLEMICRYAKSMDYVRIKFIAEKLHVKPSSASKMIHKLNEQGFVDFEKYGMIKPTQQGWKLGEYLLYRHNVLNDFFCLLNGSENEIKQVEQIEHFINKETIKNIEKLVKAMKLQK